MTYPENLKYTKEHEWAELINATTLRVGITHHAQSALGDIVYLDLPKVGTDLTANQTFGVVESIKAVSDLYSPVRGRVLAIHSDLVSDPARINAAPHTEWMIELSAPDAHVQFDGLMNAGAYAEYVATLP